MAPVIESSEAGTTQDSDGDAPRVGAGGGTHVLALFIQPLFHVSCTFL